MFSLLTFFAANVCVYIYKSVEKGDESQKILELQEEKSDIMFSRAQFEFCTCPSVSAVTKTNFACHSLCQEALKTLSEEETKELFNL